MKQKIMKGLRKLVIGLFTFILFTTVLATIIIQYSGDSNFQYDKPSNLVINDITALNPITVGSIIKPITTSDIITAINNSSGPISIGGGRYSMGGQTAYTDSIHFDMRSFNKILQFDKENKTIRVQSGTTWRDIQAFIDPHDLSIRIMQTYANFTVGGSLSVNAHGRYIGEGPLVNSILSIKIILANGSEVTASKDKNTELFYGAIGGYGGLGIITEATLSLTNNQKIERLVETMQVVDYRSYFADNIQNNHNMVFHNGDLYPPNYDKVRAISWGITEKPVTVEERLRSPDTEYKWSRRIAEFVGDYSIGKSIRQYLIDPLLYFQEKVVWRNWEASYDVKEIEPKSRAKKTYVLREYFIPVDKFDEFVPIMKDIFTRNRANIINVSIRHANAAPENLLSWARDEVFAFVVYYQQGVDKASKAQVEKWSLEMIDASIAMGGTYYLPYQIFASADQFLAAYPNANDFFNLKNRVDPKNRFTNQLWKTHYPKATNTLDNAKHRLNNYSRPKEQTVLTIPEWYLVFNPVEYATFLEEGSNPSDFPFFASINEYWTLYDKAVAISSMYNNDNDQYMTMLKVIGISTTIEYMYKGIYENTIGRITRWSSGGKNTQEDIIIAQAQHAYSELIFEKAWYEFNFCYWISRIWKDTELFGDNFIRKTERKLFLTFEFGFKSIYASLIGFASKVSYEQSNGLIYMTVQIPEKALSSLPEKVTIIDQEGDTYLLSVPRWGAFTDAVSNLVSLGVSIIDISGNQKIAVTFITPTHSNLSTAAGSTEFLFDSKFVSKPDLTRKAVLVKVSYLESFLSKLHKNGQKLEHIYDF